MNDDKVIPVRVALRARPLVPKEIYEGCQNSLSFVPNEPQVIVGQDKAFTFDYVFPCESKQKELYNAAISDRIDCLFKGYNVTVLAYGQTGSGKTFTMGTSYCLSTEEDEESYGVIQRAVKDIFKGIEERSSVSEFLVKVSFLEVYKEDVYDLLQKKDSVITIREDQDGIKIVGLTEQPVTSALETFQTLEQGSMARTTASTAMNARSSRSHAIFTISVEQRALSDSTDLRRAKFHLVDLAGSERANKTGALGERFKEGVNINRGLLALGNVISALCDDASHVPYRDSKLTRLLQDSLGGNSHTIMIACVSPADTNLDETINTLRYADRARKIKNKPIINRDPQNAELMKLRHQVQLLQLQLMQGQPSNGIQSNKAVDDKSEEDLRILLERNKHLETENQRLAKELQCSLNRTTAFYEKAMMAEMNKEKIIKKLKKLKIKTNETIEALLSLAESNPEVVERLKLLQEMQNKIVEIQCEQIQRNEEFSVYSPSKRIQDSPSKDDLENSPSQSTKTNVATESDDELFSPLKNISDDSNVDDAEHLESTLKQAAMSRELQELDRALKLKEDIASKMKENDSQMAVMRIHFESNLKQMEEEINALQKEKEDLLHALKAVQATANASKVSEQRRKRLQELELKISELKRQVQEKGKILKMKQEAERKVNQLQQDIQNMRATRVKLLRQIKEEADRYRAFKREKDREVAQLKQKDRKRQYEMTKLKQDFAKQKCVLKRKMEEAAAATRRLNDALRIQKNVAERRSKEKQQSVQGIGSRVQQWLSQEIEVLLSSKEAQHHLDILVEDRKTISEQLNLLKKSIETGEPPEKKRTGDSTDEDDELNTREITEQIEALQKEFDIRNLQIASLQRQIFDADQDEKTKHRWESIQSMVEAKCALKWLFDVAVATKFDLYLNSSKTTQQVEALENQLNTTTMQVKVLTENQDRLNKQIRNMKQHYEEKMARLIRENEDKTLYLLKQLNLSSNSSTELDPALSERIKFQETEIARLSYLNDELQKKSVEVDDLREQLRNARFEGTKPKLLNNIYDLDGVHKKANETIVIRKEASIMEEYLEDSLETSYDDENDDPEWRATPLYKRMRERISKKSQGSDSIEDKKMKASTSTEGCGCKVSCGTNRCSCKKNRKSCGDLCRCCSKKCVNRDSLGSDSGEDMDVLNGTFVKNNDSANLRTALTEISNNSVDKNESGDFVKPSKKHRRKLYKAEDSISIIDESGIKKRGLNERSEKLLTPPVI